MNRIRTDGRGNADATTDGHRFVIADADEGKVELDHDDEGYHIDLSLSTDDGDEIGVLLTLSDEEAFALGRLLTNSKEVPADD
jgi:hypothetical protein